MAGAVRLAVRFTRRPQFASVSSWIFFLLHRSGVGHLRVVCETFLCAVAEACKSQRLREEKAAAVGIIPRS